MERETAMKILKELHDNSLFSNRIALETLIPELADSNDERIRKALLEMVHDTTGDELWVDYNVHKEEALAWLEKQGESYTKKDVDDAYLKGISDAKHELEKQGEQKHINDTDEEIVNAVKDTSVLDMVEPKFKVGDWVIDKQGIVHQIANVIENLTNHTYGYDIVGGGYFNDNTEGVRLWTIKDAKDGDVLASDNSIFIFQEEYIAEKPIAYCGLMNGLFVKGEDACWTNEKCHPATKEQRELLFERIKAAGYEWDAEKKELKIIDWSKHIKYEPDSPSIIEQKPVWNDEDENYLQSAENACEYQYGKNTSTILWLKSLKDRVQPKQVCGVEDEKHILSIEQVLNCADLLNVVPEKINVLKDWLKSLKDRVQPKPKEWNDEDEKIRKALVRFHKSTIDIDGIKGADILAWLEKQGESYTKKDIDDAYLKGICDAKNELEKQGEQKPVDKVEPFDKYEGLTDFERTLADICIGWTGEEIGWKDYIIKNSLPLLEIAKRQYNKEYLFSQCSKI